MIIFPEDSKDNLTVAKSLLSISKFLGWLDYWSTFVEQKQERERVKMISDFCALSQYVFFIP